MKEKPLIYIAGPLFTVHQRYFLEDIAEITKNAGFDVYLPHRENNESAMNELYDDIQKKEIFENDVNAILRAKAIIALLDGVDVDSGTAFEIGLAYAFKKPVLGIRSDMRLFMENMSVNLMIEQACQQILFIDENNFAKLEDFIYEFLDNL